MLSRTISTLYSLCAISALIGGQSLNQSGLLNISHFMGWASGIATFIMLAILIVCMFIPIVWEGIARKQVDKKRFWFIFNTSLDIIFLGLVIWIGWTVLAIVLFVDLVGVYLMRKVILGNKSNS